MAAAMRFRPLVALIIDGRPCRYLRSNLRVRSGDAIRLSKLLSKSLTSPERSSRKIAFVDTFLKTAWNRILEIGRTHLLTPVTTLLLVFRLHLLITQLTMISINTIRIYLSIIY